MSSPLSRLLEMRLFAKGEGEGHCGHSAIMEPVLGKPVILILLYCSVYVPLSASHSVLSTVDCSCPEAGANFSSGLGPQPTQCPVQ